MAIPRQRQASDDLIGREAEIEATMRLLEGRARLLTLTGPPGVGKTRLALELMARRSERFADGSAFVDLSSSQDHVSAFGELGQAIGVGAGAGDRTGMQVNQVLMDREMLIVLDNAERVPDLAPELAIMLSSCPRLQVLVTSRESMHLSQEHEFSVPPLAMPTTEDRHDLAKLAATPSVAVFVAAAKAVRPDFEVTEENAAAVAEICIRLDGLPLALTLAAVRVKMFSASDIAARLRDRRALLEATAHDVPARHRTLRAAISWSHAVLPDAERRLFRRLGIFNAAWSLDAAYAVCGEGDLDVLTVLSSLVDKSLVQRVDAESEQASFFLLESLREYAGEQLDEHHERDSVAAYHAAYCIAQAQSAERSLSSAGEGAFWVWTSRHEGDLRAALDWCVASGDIDGALSLATALAWSWYARGNLGAALTGVNHVLALAADAPSPPDASALTAARIIAAVLNWGRGDLDRAEQLLKLAHDDCLERADDRRLAMAYAFLGHVARDRGDFDAGALSHDEAARLYDGIGSARGSAWARFDLGRVAWQRGTLEEAAALLRDALTRFRDLRYQWASAWTSWALGNVDVELGHVDDGAHLLGSALTDFDAVADLRGVAMCWESLATIASVRGDHNTALHLVGAATALRQRLEAPLTSMDQARVTDTEERARAAVGDFLTDRERQVGKTLPSTAANMLAREIAEGTGEPASSTAADPTEAPADVLTPREQEVARLVAEGCTNQQIGRRLGITARTAEAHLHNIRAKLDARSRSEVAVWAVTHGLVSASSDTSPQPHMPG